MSHRHYAERKEAVGHSSMGVFLIFNALCFDSRLNTHGFILTFVQELENL